MTDIPTSAIQNMTVSFAIETIPPCAIPCSQLRDSELDPPPVTKAKSPRSPQYEFPFMPADARTCGRYYFFGFPAASRALAKLAEDHYGPDEDPDSSDYTAWDGLNYLRALSGYRHLHLFSGVAQEGEEPQEEGLYTPVIPGEKATPVVGVYMNRRGFAHRLPTQKQMGVLVNVLGQPRWCMDAWRMEDFDCYGVPPCSNICSQLRQLELPLVTREGVTKPLRYHLPPMPADARICGRYYFFGFPATFSALAKLAEDRYGPVQDPEDSEYTAWDGLNYLRALSGYRYLYLFSGVAQDGEEPQEEGSYTPVIPGEKPTPVVGVYVNRREFAHRLPTQSQMNALVKVLGQPRWCMDAWCMEDFDCYGVM